MIFSLKRQGSRKRYKTKPGTKSRKAHMKHQQHKETDAREATPKTDDPLISVVVATIGRDDLLIETVTRLLECDYDPFEIVVVDQTPKPTDRVSRFMDDNNQKVRYIHKDTPGLPEARNDGIEKARGDIVVFVDDDVIADPGLIAAHSEAYTEDGIAGVAGRVLPPGGAKGKRKVSPGRVAKIGWFGLISHDNFDADVKTPAHHVRGCNMSFKRQILRDVGGFDGRFGGSAHLEETDLAMRVRRAGGRLVFEPKASLIHLLEPEGGCRPKNLKHWFGWYGHNFALFYLKNYPKPLFLFSAFCYFVKLPASAVKNGSIGVIPWGAVGFFRGVRTYRRG